MITVTEQIVEMTINGTKVSMKVSPRESLADALRDRQRLTGIHLGCEQGVCGACTVLIDDLPMRSCLTLALSCEGAEVVTVEGLQGDDADRLRESFSTEGALQCGFCTSGMLMTGYDLVRRRERMGKTDVAEALAGNVCRCTGYNGLVKAIVAANEGGIAAETDNT